MFLDLCLQQPVSSQVLCIAIQWDQVRPVETRSITVRPCEIQWDHVKYSWTMWSTVGPRETGKLGETRWIIVRHTHSHGANGSWSWLVARVSNCCLRDRWRWRHSISWLQYDRVGPGDYSKTGWDWVTPREYSQTTRGHLNTVRPEVTSLGWTMSGEARSDRPGETIPCETSLKQVRLGWASNKVLLSSPWQGGSFILNSVLPYGRPPPIWEGGRSHGDGERF